MNELFRVPFIKTISSVRYDRSLGFGYMLKGNPINQDFICNVKYGDLLKGSGDILLCPVSEHFKPSNPFSRKVLEIEGKQLKRALEGIDTLPHFERKKLQSETGYTDSGLYFGSGHAAFMPCRKLKYRGLLFVALDFYSDNRTEINAQRIAEALIVASTYKCKKLSCPGNLLYEPDRYQFGYDGLYIQLETIIEKLPANIQIDFIIEYVIKKDLFAYSDLSSTMSRYDYSTALIEYLPDCAQILPWYKRRLRSVRTVYNFTDGTAKLIKKILTPETLNKKQLFNGFKKLRKIMGDYEETGVGHCNEGFAFFLLRLCKEMPWMFNELTTAIKEFYAQIGYEKGLDEFIFRERFGNLKKR